MEMIIDERARMKSVYKMSFERIDEITRDLCRIRESFGREALPNFDKKLDDAGYFISCYKYLDNDFEFDSIREEFQIMGSSTSDKVWNYFSELRDILATLKLEYTDAKEEMKRTIGPFKSHPQVKRLLSCVARGYLYKNKYKPAKEFFIKEIGPEHADKVMKAIFRVLD